MRPRRITVLMFALAIPLALGACKHPSPTPLTADAFKAYYEACKSKDLAAYKKSLSKSTLESYELEGKAHNQSLDEVVRHYLDQNQAYIVETQSGMIRVLTVTKGLVRRTNTELPNSLPTVRNKKTVGDMATVEVEDQPGKWDTAFFYREDGGWKLGGSAAISGKITTPLGPPKSAGINFVSYANEDCAKLSEKKSLTGDEDSRYRSCMKEQSAWTNETGEYEFRGFPTGWYRLMFGWSVALGPNLVPGTEPLDLFPLGPELEGGYKTNYGREKEKPERFRITVRGSPFYFNASDGATRNITYLGAPYKSAQN
jgi:hypothetical protein